jgi:hypothetical protein
MSICSTPHSDTSPSDFNHLALGTDAASLLCKVAVVAANTTGYQVSKAKGVFMSFQNESKANWIKSFQLDSNLTVSISDKGSIMLRYTDNNRFIACFQATVMETLVNAAGDLGNILTSPEYKAVIESKERAKVAKYAEKQVAQHILKAQKLAQAALDALKASGMSEEQAKQVLKIA